MMGPDEHVLVADKRRQELDRASSFYEETSTQRPGDWYNSPFNPASCAQRHQVDMAVLRLLSTHGVRDLKEAKAADFGCGVGLRLQWLADLGANHRNLYGVDLSDERIQAARLRLPFAALEVGSADETSLGTESRDIVAQFCLFSSILDEGLREAVAAEMDRVLVPGGHILWQDVRPPSLPLRAIYGVRRVLWWLLRGRSRGESLRSPGDSYVLLSRAAVRSLFPGYGIDGGPAGVSRDIVPVRGRWSAVASAVADLLPPLRIYCVFMLTKPRGSPTAHGTVVASDDGF